MARRHRRHSTKLKLQLARAYLNGEGSFKSIAKEHDISHALLMRWVEKYRQDDLTEEQENAESILDYKAHIAALERKVGQLVMELDALKKRREILSGEEMPLTDSELLDFQSGRGVKL